MDQHFVVASFTPILFSANRADRVKYESDGTLRFVGRVDSQTKLNGQRLELNEVEYHVSQHLPGLRTIADIVEPRGGPRSLAIFVEEPEVPLNSASSSYSAPSLSSLYSSSTASLTSSSLTSPCLIADCEEACSNEEVARILESSILKHQLSNCRAVLQEHLPSFMVPSLFIPVTRLPQTLSNKLDRKTLRGLVSEMTFEQLHLIADPSLEGFQTPNKKLTPETSSQLVLQKLWAKVLGVPTTSIGIDDNFFSMGGDSIRAIRLATLMSAESPQRPRIPASVVFQKPQLRNMAKTLESGDNDIKLAKRASIQPASLELIHATPAEREEVLQYCASSLGLAVESIQDIYPATPGKCPFLQETFPLWSPSYLKGLRSRRTWEHRPPQQLYRHCRLDAATQKSQILTPRSCSTRSYDCSFRHISKCLYDGTEVDLELFYELREARRCLASHHP